jgi:hypothetical protein
MRFAVGRPLFVDAARAISVCSGLAGAARGFQPFAVSQAGLLATRAR